MALLAKKFYVKKGSTTYAHNIYSRTGDISTGAWMGVTADGTTGYVAAGATTASGSTPGRIKKPNGNTYALQRAAPVSYEYSLYWQNGNFTVPQGVYVIRATAVGGGCGGCVAPAVECQTTSFSGTRNRVNTTISGGQSGIRRNSSNIINARGGAAPAFNVQNQNNRYCCNSGPDGCTKYGYYDTLINTVPSYGTTNRDWVWTQDYQAGAPAVKIYRYDGTFAAQAGDGGACDNNISNWICPGANGYKTTKNLTVTPGEVLSVYIGSGGPWQGGSSLQYSNWNSGGYGGTMGSQGVVLIEWGGSIGE